MTSTPSSDISAMVHCLPTHESHGHTFPGPLCLGVCLWVSKAQLGPSLLCSSLCNFKPVPRSGLVSVSPPLKQGCEEQHLFPRALGTCGQILDMAQGDSTRTSALTVNITNTQQQVTPKGPPSILFKPEETPRRKHLSSQQGPPCQD